MTISPPHNPIAAVVHPDPYFYYADLATNRPIYRDEQAGLWVAASAAMVGAVLTSDLCRVRPPAEPVPRALLGSLAADIFRRLVRMNDGQMHSSMKGVVSRSLHAVDADQLMEQSTRWARLLIDEMEPGTHTGRLADFAFHLPVYVVASLLGIPEERLPQMALWMGDFVRCLAPTSSSEQIEQGKNAASHLWDLLYAALDVQEAQQAISLLSMLGQEAQHVGYRDRDVLVANGIGLLSQSYEATAGLIGNTLLALARYPEIHRQVLNDPDLLHLVIQEVIRYDPPIQNTRRFLARDGVVAGVEMREGDAVLVVLAAANRDPEVYADPERFDIFRKERCPFTFGVGEHLCPGDDIATIIARAGVEQLLLSSLELSHLTEIVGYRPSGNARVPLFG